MLTNKVLTLSQIYEFLDQQQQESKMIHAQSLGLIPEEGDLCITAATAREETEYYVFAYIAKRWTYHTTLTYTSKEAYIRHCTLLKKFGHFEEGYYRKTT